MEFNLFGLHLSQQELGDFHMNGDKASVNSLTLTFAMKLVAS